MNKPISLSIDEARKSIITAINNTDLPVSILEIIIKNIYDDIYMLKEKELQEDLYKYQNLDNENNNDNNENETNNPNN